jgi:hypothetical protein
MAKIKCKKLISFLLILMIPFCVYCGIIYAIKHRIMALPSGIVTHRQTLDAYTRLCKEYDDLCDNESDYYYKTKIEQDLNLKCYLYKEKRISKLGDSNCYFRTIRIDTRVTGYTYCETFAHETMHLKYYTANERFVCYETFKYLYESEELHNVGVWYGLKQLNGDCSGEYDISGLVVNYLTNK